MSRRLLITAGDSRVGKSTTSRLLLDFFLQSQFIVRAYYNGQRNKLSSYSKFLPVGELQLTRGGADSLLVDLYSFDETEVVLTDLPGQHLPEFKTFVRETLFFEQLLPIGYRVTFVHPISHRRDCVEYLQELLEFCGNDADYLLVKNLHFGEDFKYYDSADIQSFISQLKVVELCLNNLPIYAYQALEDCSLPYSEAVLSTEIDVIFRSMIFNWMEDFYDKIRNTSTVSRYLGLSADESVREKLAF